jgi:hypothetical protein
MKIKKSDYISGLWYYAKYSGTSPGYSVILLTRDTEQVWHIYIKTVFRVGSGTTREQEFSVSGYPSEETMKERVEMVSEMAKHFLNDYFEYIDIKGNYSDLTIKIAMSEKLDIDVRNIEAE